MDKMLAENVSSFIKNTCGKKSLKEWLEENYLWPNAPGKRIALYEKFNCLSWNNEKLDIQDNDCYEKTKFIKERISKRLKSVNGNNEEIESLVEFFISDWGGVRRNSEDTIKGIIRTRMDMNGQENIYYQGMGDDGVQRTFNRFSLKSNPRFNSGSVSSWSKYLVVAYPTWAKIYDARIAYALNSFIFIGNMDSCLLWPMPTGVNSKIGLLSIETLILLQQSLSRELIPHYSSLTDSSNAVANFRNRYYKADNDTYGEYLKLLTNIANILQKDNPGICLNSEEIESFLFMVSDSLLFDEVTKKFVQISETDKS